MKANAIELLRQTIKVEDGTSVGFHTTDGYIRVNEGKDETWAVLEHANVVIIDFKDVKYYVDTDTIYKIEILKF